MRNRPPLRCLSIDDLHAAAAVGVYPLARASALWSRSLVRWRVSDRRWQQPARAVVVTHNGALSREQTMWIALIAAPDGSVLAAGTAAELDGLAGFSDPVITVAIPNSARKPGVPSGIRVIRSMEISELDVHLLNQPPRTRIARSLLNMAIGFRHENRSRAVLLAGCQQGLTRPEALTEALSRRGPCRHRRLIRETIGDASGGTQSLPEGEFDNLCGV